MVSRVLGDRYEICQQLGRNAGRRTLLARDLQTQQHPWKRILPVDGSERERELFPDRGWVHLTPPPIPTAPRRQETGFLRGSCFWSDSLSKKPGFIY